MQKEEEEVNDDKFQKKEEKAAVDKPQKEEDAANKLQEEEEAEDDKLQKEGEVVNEDKLQKEEEETDNNKLQKKEVVVDKDKLQKKEEDALAFPLPPKNSNNNNSNNYYYYNNNNSKSQNWIFRGTSFNFWMYFLFFVQHAKDSNLYIYKCKMCLFVTIWNPNYWMDLRQNCMDHPLETAVVLQKNFGGDPPQAQVWLEINDIGKSRCEDAK